MEKLINNIIADDLFNMDVEKVKRYLKINNITNDDIIDVMEFINKNDERYFDSVSNDVVELVMHGIIEILIF